MRSSLPLSIVLRIFHPKVSKFERSCQDIGGITGEQHPVTTDDHKTAIKKHRAGKTPRGFGAWKKSRQRRKCLRQIRRISRCVSIGPRIQSFNCSTVTRGTVSQLYGRARSVCRWARASKRRRHEAGNSQRFPAQQAL